MSQPHHTSGDPADGTAASVAGAGSRYAGTAAQHTLAVARGLIRPEFAATGAGSQAWDLTIRGGLTRWNH